MKVPFSKMHGAGNDLVVVNCLQGAPFTDPEAFARFVLDRHLGVGGDQLLLVQPPKNEAAADFFMAIRNPDGSVAEMCANGIRAFYKYLRDRGLTRQDETRVETLGGIVCPRWLGHDQIEIRMTPPVFEAEKIPTTIRNEEDPTALVEVPLEVAGRRLHATVLSMGNPHCVIFVDDVADFPVEELGPRIERSPWFPQRTNVEFAQTLSAAEIVQRTWERGTGETLACGSGACATAVAGILSGRTDRNVHIRLTGGILRVRWPENAGPVWLTGPAAHVFDGELEIP